VVKSVASWPAATSAPATRLKYASAPPLGEKPRRTNPTFNFSEGFTCTPSA
jgi:hypothetical protein